MYISILYMFRAAMCPSSGQLLYQCHTWFMSLCIDDRLVCRLSGELLYQGDTLFMSLCVDDRLVCRLSGELLYQGDTLFMSLCVDDRLVYRLTCIPDGHLHKVTKTRCHTDTVILLMMETWLTETRREQK